MKSGVAASVTVDAGRLGDGVTAGIGPMKSGVAASVTVGAGRLGDGVTASIGPIKSGDGGAMTICVGAFGSASSACTGRCDEGSVSSNFRISIAPVSISVAVLTGAASSPSTTESEVSPTAVGWVGMAMSWAVSNSLSSPVASPAISPSDPGSPAIRSDGIASGPAISDAGAKPAISMAAAGRNASCVCGKVGASI